MKYYTMKDGNHHELVKLADPNNVLPLEIQLYIGDFLLLEIPNKAASLFRYAMYTIYKSVLTANYFEVQQVEFPSEQFVSSMLSCLETSRILDVGSIGDVSRYWFSFSGLPNLLAWYNKYENLDDEYFREILAATPVTNGTYMCLTCCEDFTVNKLQFVLNMNIRCRTCSIIEYTRLLSYNNNYLDVL